MDAVDYLSEWDAEDGTLQWAGPYERIEVVGQGTAGTAWLGRHKQTGREVAVKEVSLEGLSEEAVMNAKNEVEVLKGLVHPYIVRLEDSFEEDGRLIIITEYCKEGDLESYLDTLTTPLPLAITLRYFAQLCSAVSYLHSNCIIHRDLKTANIFLAGSGVAKLGDFGVAKVLPNQTSFTGTMVGTPFYFSPEVCEGLPYDSKSDVWSLGVVLYQMLMLKQPFQAGNIMALVNLITNTKPEPLPPSIPLDVIELVDQLLDKLPQSRPTITSVLKSPCIARYVHELEIAEAGKKGNRDMRQEAMRNKMKLQRALLEEEKESGMPGAVWTISPGAKKKAEIKEVEEGGRYLCDQCTVSNSFAEVHCMECGFYLCDRCHTKLHSMRTFQNHHIATLPKPPPPPALPDISSTTVEDVDDIIFIPVTDPSQTPNPKSPQWILESPPEFTTPNPDDPRHQPNPPGNVLSLLSSASTVSDPPEISQQAKPQKPGCCSVM
eukprot:TRINITY_DN19218_c0_g1_i1.p1 TRINITY_DN19218_c0_g1~~TRINITY_DN19218_c0_g1_i1.p1  ORF type:complete len:517 (+),score=39.94 TRINITY_DN19218_c0_g1_i1:79-1551(+)